jgi:thiamine biosynthesis lipoprotein
MRRARPLLGTLVDIQTRDLEPQAASQAINAAFAAIETVQKHMSFHDPLSTLTRLNRLASHGPVQVDEGTYAVLECAREMHRISGGLFDVSVAPRLQALGFLPHHGTDRAPDTAARHCFSDVELLEDFHVRFHRSGMALDLGGIAKGYAVDQAINALRRHGAPAGLVNAGGDLRAFGAPGFAVSIRHPVALETPLASGTLCERALATSAHYFADRLVDGSALGPILDPPSGRQAADARSASVLAKSAMVADALTKVLILSPKTALSILEELGAEALLVAKDGQTLCGPGWHASFHL